ncbi:MAG: tRNA 4-thiouridine(8) synthase ThiI [Lachnospiraceae bacterium]|nr:tRNA 4-thiouridine(8) synthase ThiI [Lachnospiraceae bacterium]
MKYSTFLIKYAEIAVKGKNRYVFEDALMHRIRLVLKHVEGDYAVTKSQGRVYVDCLSACDEDEVIAALKRVFGINGICPVVKTDTEDFESLKEEVVKFVDDQYPDKNHTFKVFAKRARKTYPVSSMEMNCAIGEAVLEAYPSMKVDVHKPEIEIHVEVRESIFIYSKQYAGPGGMPVGTNGKAMLLLSGGIDSPVAGYMIAKRGVKIDAVYFHAPPYTSERAKQKVVDLARLVSRYTGTICLHVINFTDIQLAIYEKCPHEELTIIMRRYMMRIAERLACDNGCLGLITGESIGQVASQTVQSLAVTNEVCTLPVFRPLIGFDKLDIIALSEKIGTFETSILPYEDCCTIFVAKHPVTKPDAMIIRRSETKLADVIDELVEKAIETDEVINVI